MRGEGREVYMTIKEQHERDLYDDGIILYLVVGGCYIKIYIYIVPLNGEGNGHLLQ